MEGVYKASPCHLILTGYPWVSCKHLNSVDASNILCAPPVTLFNVIFFSGHLAKTAGVERPQTATAIRLSNAPVLPDGQ